MSNYSWPPHFTVDNARVLQLFTGENFYSDCDAALREAVLNSIDAIVRRQTKNPIAPIIRVTFSEAEQRISVWDNGDGMDEQAVATLFARVGASASRFMAKDGGRSASAIGEFGIGALSYFLVCDEFLLSSIKDASKPVGLKLTKKMLDGESPAEAADCDRTDVGTTITFLVSKPEIFVRLRDRFSYWFRSVDGLSGSVDRGEPVCQGGLARAIRQLQGLDAPEWVDRAEIGPPQDASLLSTFDGKGRVDVLYHGVFVERLEVNQLWGIEGAVHVDPKHFRPKLNREGFVGQHLRAELEPFLRECHPSALKELVLGVRDLLADKKRWNEFRAVTLWLAVPRSNPAYAEAAALWDKEFRSYKAFRLLVKDEEQEVSIEDIVALRATSLYVAPDRINPNSLEAQAVRILRAQGEPIIQGIRREEGFMSSATLQSSSSTWLLSSFDNELPPRYDVSAVAEDTVSKQSLADIYTNPVPVRVIELGPGASPFVVVKNEVWINVENEAGKSIVLDVCSRNEGYLGLWTSCMLYGSDNTSNLASVASLLRPAAAKTGRLGLVRRQYLKSLIR